jgi:RimJ/RimL family protein N-acetyltransferase
MSNLIIKKMNLENKTLKSFETDRLFLKPTSKEDAPFILELYNTEKWLKYIGDRNIRSIQDAENFISTKITPHFKRLGFGAYTLIRKSDGLKIGTCGLYDREGLEGVDIGFAFLPAYEKMGYGYESASKVLEVSKTEFNIQQICAITVKENIDSQNLLKKLGLEFVKMIKIPNDEVALMLFK